MKDTAKLLRMRAEVQKIEAAHRGETLEPRTDGKNWRVVYDEYRVEYYPWKKIEAQYPSEVAALNRLVERLHDTIERHQHELMKRGWGQE